MDGIIDPILRRLRDLELKVFGPASDDSGHDVPAQTLAPSRQPIVPGVPIANYDPSVHQDDETDAAIAAENEWKATPNRDTGIVPDDIGSDPGTADNTEIDPDDPTLNADGTPKRRKKKGWFAGADSDTTLAAT